MFLRSITLRGFKSFADKTLLDFIPGVSVIVGPNGSGKSNLVDAISWALGEQGPRALRGGQMSDVIFAGSPARPALGMAEVKLVIDNTAGLIPVPMTEIEISRAIFRSGESEYRIGGQVVRLLDIQELLSETGIGRALHTVVGQGQLEDVLTSRPEERRKYVEEAAGIAKHRARKVRSERKLSGLDQDLLRLQDVLAELRRQLKPLRQQAEMAKRHEQLTTQAEELSQRLAAARLRALLAERERRQSGWDEGLELRRAARERLDSLDADVLGASEERAAAARDMTAAEQAFRRAQESRSHAEHALRARIDREAAAREALASQGARAAKLEALDAELARVESELARVVGGLEAQESALDEAEREFRAAVERRHEVEDARRRLSEEAAGRRAEIDALRRSLTGYERERERLAETVRGVREGAAALQTEREALETEIEKLDGQSSPLTERRSQLEEERRRLVEKLEELEEAERRMTSRRDLLEARRRDIEETPGSRFLSSHGGRAVGLLKDLVRVQPGLERALVAALGPLADAVVYEDAERALADAPSGDGAILAIAAGGPVRLGLREERSLLSAVDAQPAARGIVSTVLRDVYLAATVEEAAVKQSEHPNASFVTAEGVLVGPAVIHTAAEADARVREIHAEMRVLEHDLAATRNALKPRRERLAEIAGEVQFLREQMDAADSEITSSAERIMRVEADLGALVREQEMLAQRLDVLDDSAAVWRDRLSAVEPEHEELPALPPTPEPPIRDRVSVETLRRERTAFDRRRAELRKEREGLAAQDPVRLKEDLQTAEARRSTAEEALRAAEERAFAETAARESAAEREREATQREVDVNRDWRVASTELDQLRETYEDEDRLRGDVERRIREAERLLREGHGSEPADALAALHPDDNVESLEKRSELVQRRLALLGRVNLLAGGEFEAVQERHDFMQRELDDVRKARRDLLEVISRIDLEITETFDAAYRDVAREFERLIADLFPGGEGRLILTDPANPLESGIEIEASPGRKRVKRISLLSGGERALTAMAFLFAIFTARPSPFYLMDEVEPALDDVNLYRFLKLVDGFAQQSQVMIVTHQKRTMEIAGMMYGVSMSKDGTSKIVCQTLAEPAQDSTAPVDPESVVTSVDDELVEVPADERVHEPARP
ncbi:MAG TPA: chromosome segregation protein SMC [Actinomycetota bacterium]|jgi:chromosome segregation protein|nr:chromosome segregation protein SMC [Actinomycetota bacterium]